MTLRSRARRRVEACPAVTAAAVLLLAFLTLPAALEAASLRPSHQAMERQNRVARERNVPFSDTHEDLIARINRRELVPITGEGRYLLKEVSYPVGLPALRDFVEHLAEAYGHACGEPMVVTSLARPRREQPANASRLSVHPAGMAVDLRRSWSSRCRRWLESRLLALEARGLLEATYERHPPHYHVAVFPEPYERYLSALSAAPQELTHIVVRGETLWRIAQQYGTSVEEIKRSNALRSSRIHPGQELRLPGTR